MLCTVSNITARIPLQSAARTSHADSFSPGEAIGDAAPHDTVNNNLYGLDKLICKGYNNCVAKQIDLRGAG